MSYLLDALRKAERERNLGRVPELSYAVTESVSLAGKRVPVWVLLLVVSLVVLNIGLVAAFWWLGQDNAAPPVDIHTKAASSTSEQALSEPQKLPRDQVSPEKPSPVTAPLQQSAQVQEPQSRQPAAVSEPEYTSDPAEQVLPEIELEVGKAPHFNELPEAQQAVLPTLTINGHLFSSIPGRSFVLINSRRYHEGQRIAQGPAVVAIDEQGVILRMGDINYRLDAPR